MLADGIYQYASQSLMVGVSYVGDSYLYYYTYTYTTKNYKTWQTITNEGTTSAFRYYYYAVPRYALNYYSYLAYSYIYYSYTRSYLQDCTDISH